MGHLATPGPDTGFFSTGEVPAGAGKDQRFSRVIGLPKGQTGQGPCIRAGVNAINLDAVPGGSIRLSASIENVNLESFEVVAQTWNTSILNDATLTWIEHKEDAKDTQTGWWQTNNYQQSSASYRLNFNTPFDEPPNVVMWFHYLDLVNNTQWRIHTYAADITRQGFEIKIDCWNTNQFFKAGVTWIAYKKGKLDIDSGKFCEDSQRAKLQPRKTREVEFGGGKFVQPPTVLSGISMIDHTSSKPLKIASLAKGVSARGFTWSLETETAWTCNAEYIAIGQTPVAQAGGAMVEMKDDKEIHAQRDDWIVQRARSLEQLRLSLSEWEDNLKKREAAIEEANGHRVAAVEQREAAAKVREDALAVREEGISKKEAQREPPATNGIDGHDERDATIQQQQEEVEQLKARLADETSKRAPMRPSRATVQDGGDEDTVESALPRPPIQPPARELPAGNLDWGFDQDLLARFNQGMAGRNLMRPSRKEREQGAVW